MRRVLLVLLMILAVSVSAQQVGSGRFHPDLGNPLFRNLSSWWRGVPGFAWGASWYDISAYANHGTLLNMATSTTSGWNVTDRRGGLFHLAFDGTDDGVTTTQLAGIDMNNAWTACLWALSTSTSASQTLLGNRSETLGGGMYWMWNGWSTSQIRSTFGMFPASDVGLTEVAFPDLFYLSLNTWNHLCIRYDGSQVAAGMTMFMDGQLVATIVSQGPGSFTSFPDRVWRIGQRDNGGWPFQGSLDDIMIWRRALTDLEIARVRDQSLLGWSGLQRQPPVPAIGLAVAAPAPGKFLPFFR